MINACSRKRPHCCSGTSNSNQVGSLLDSAMDNDPKHDTTTPLVPIPSACHHSAIQSGLGPAKPNQEQTARGLVFTDRGLEPSTDAPTDYLVDLVQDPSSLTKPPTRTPEHPPDQHINQPTQRPSQPERATSSQSRVIRPTQKTCERPTQLKTTHSDIRSNSRSQKRAIRRKSNQPANQTSSNKKPTKPTDSVVSSHRPTTLNKTNQNPPKVDPRSSRQSEVNSVVSKLCYTEPSTHSTRVSESCYTASSTHSTRMTQSQYAAPSTHSTRMSKNTNRSTVFSSKYSSKRAAKPTSIPDSW